MTPKRYTANSLIVRWAYLGNDVRPLQTSSCAIFWRCVVWTPLKVLFPLLVGLNILTLIVMGAWNTVSYETVPEWMRAERPPDGFNWRPMAWFAGVAMAIFAGAKFAGWASQFCTPVEIEGGLVQRGSCPNCHDVRMVEQLPDANGRDGVWMCRTCEGVFYLPKHIEATES